MDAMLWACFQGSAMVILLLAIRALFINSIPKVLLPIAWTAIFVRLLMPIPLPLPFSIWSIFQIPGADAVGTGISLSASPGVTPEPAGQPAAPPFAPLDFIGIIWALGSVLVLAVLLVSYFRYIKNLKANSTEVDGELANTLVGSVHLRRKIEIRQSLAVSTPMTYGILRPTIVIPLWLSQQNDPSARLAVLHELVHISRFDTALKAFSAFATAVYWFNPIVWIANRAFSRDIELSCDERALQLLSTSERKAYARLLLRAAEIKKDNLNPGLAFGYSAIGKRIAAIAKYKTRSPLVTIAVGICMSVPLLGLASSPMAGMPLWDIETDQYSFSLPASWRDQTTAVTNGNTMTIYVKDNPQLPLLEVMLLEDDEASPTATEGYLCLSSTARPGGGRVEFWCINYVGMSLGDLWRTADFANPPYPGEELEQEVISLHSGGSLTAETLWRLDKQPSNSMRTLTMIGQSVVVK